MLPSIIFLIMAALCSPKARSAMRLAFRIVLMPIVIAPAGTFSVDPKKCAASLRERWSRSMRRVCEDACEPGSLKPMLPISPIPSI